MTQGTRRYPKPVPQKQDHEPGIESEMSPRPEYIRADYRGSGKLAGKVALVTGGDSGIGRSIAVHYAREGADVMIGYLNEHPDALETKRLVELENTRCEVLSGDVGDELFCVRLVEETVRIFGHLDILVNNAAEQHPSKEIEEISSQQLERTFKTNIFAFFYLVKAALPSLKEGAAIINTTSVTAYKGSAHLLDYSATKGAIVAFTRSLSEALRDREIRVNGVAPGPIWTPLIPSTFTSDHVGKFGENYPMRRPGQPSEVGPSYVFLASEDASFMSGQILHPNGGEIVAS
ncbi:MAG: NAD(P)-dependent oxidoreductase [Bdellovibrionales bacterium RIFOXYC1_FULL_54_43]|nr:MAG: NAD(P)-dependent oxidoreductase [Bdellovibrionales bacterium RIFOXYC1_FULL_54_43]OFZ82286.1 MAG: NAD(P)-dependent oxidoreductase [Bdellovibrionales bacterium RIFOXYD1_FULL_55_31]